MLTLTTSCTAVTWTTSGRHVSTSGSSTSFPGSTASSLVKSKICKTYVCNYIIVFFLICVYFHITQSENQVVFVETRISFSKAGNTVQSRKSQLTTRTWLQIFLAMNDTFNIHVQRMYYCFEWLFVNFTCCFNSLAFSAFFSFWA